ncbi:MAG: A/G-specific adenine glycosylase [Verrucomicrobiales bacterium]
MKPPPPAAIRALLNWFRDHARDYPWRRTVDPYAILVSEMMLQQTRIQTVLDRGYYDRWMNRFPDVTTLAAAEETDVLRLWEGLGYYSRARNLLKAAKAVVERHGGKFPPTVAELEKLPGVGPYTARALAAFAFDAPVPVIDGNVIRVVARWIGYRQPVDSANGAKAIHDATAAMVPNSGGRAFGSALMELGQVICLPRNPDCESCPVGRWCVSRDKDPEALPMKKPRPAITEVEETAILALKNGRILLHRETGRRRHGLWKLPERDAKEVNEGSLILETTYSITRYKVRLRIYRAGGIVKLGPDESWIPLSELDDHPMPSPYRRALNGLV